MKLLFYSFLLLVGYIATSQDLFMTETSKVYKNTQTNDTTHLNVALQINLDESNNTLQPNAYGIIGSNPEFGELKRKILQTQSKLLYTQDTSRLTYIVYESKNSNNEESVKLNTSSKIMLQDSLMSLVLDKLYLPEDFNEISKVRSINGKEFNVKVIDGLTYFNDRIITVYEEIPYNGIIYILE